MPMDEPAGNRVRTRAPRPAMASAPVSPAARDLLADASLGLGRACAAVDPADRYAIAHLAALRAARFMTLQGGLDVVNRLADSGKLGVGERQVFFPVAIVAPDPAMHPRQLDLADASRITDC